MLLQGSSQNDGVTADINSQIYYTVRERNPSYQLTGNIEPGTTYTFRCVAEPPSLAPGACMGLCFLQVDILHQTLSGPFKMLLRACLCFAGIADAASCCGALGTNFNLS